MTRGRMVIIALVVGVLSQLIPLPGIVVAQITRINVSRVDSSSFLAIICTTNFLVFFAIAYLILKLDFGQTKSERMVERPYNEKTVS
jgi:hypothetical protein